MSVLVIFDWEHFIVYTNFIIYDIFGGKKSVKLSSLWFKVTDQKFIEYQQTSYVNTNPEAAKRYNELLKEKVFFFNGGFYKWDFTKNNWDKIETPVYEYVDYVTGIIHEWNQSAKEWKAKDSIQIVNKTETSDSTNTSAKTAPDATVAGNAEAKSADSKKKAADATKKKEWFDINDEKNTNVYVSGLPLDLTDEEFEEIMSKYGIIMKDPVTHKLKLKLYRENEEVKGDGRCCYLMVLIFHNLNLIKNIKFSKFSQSL